jgi:hypothetical protein
VAVAASAAAIVFSLGPETAAYRFLHEHVVLVRGVRALSRFSLIPVLCLSVLAGLALAGKRRLVLAAALALFLAESSNVPLRYGRYEGPSAAARWLAGKPGAVAHLPLGENDTQAMLDGIAHWRPLVNGDSGFIPRPYDRALELLAGEVTEDGLRLLRALDVRHVVSGRDLALPVAARAGEENVYDVPPGEAARIPAAGRAVPTLWSADGIVIDLGEVRDVRRVVFELDDRPWVARPAVEVFHDESGWTRVDATASLADATLALMGDPRHGQGEVVIDATGVRRLRIQPSLPARAGAFLIGE